MRIFKLIVIWAYCFLIQTAAQAQQTISPTEPSGWRAEIKEEKSSEAPGISFLSWDQTTVWVEESNDLQYTILKGRVSRPINQLNLNGKTVYVHDSGEFEIRFGFRGREKPFRITVLDGQNRVFRAQFRLTSPHLTTSPFNPYSFGRGRGPRFFAKSFSLFVWVRLHQNSL